MAGIKYTPEQWALLTVAMHGLKDAIAIAEKYSERHKFFKKALNVMRKLP